MRNVDSDGDDNSLTVRRRKVEHSLSCNNGEWSLFAKTQTEALIGRGNCVALPPDSSSCLFKCAGDITAPHRLA